MVANQQLIKDNKLIIYREKLTSLLFILLTTKTENNFS